MFIQPSSRTLVSPSRGLGGRPLMAPWWRRLIGSALATGAVRWRVRRSARAFSGAVVVAGFPNCGAAIAFASAWSWYAGCALALRRRVSAGQVLWSVSVPVLWPVAQGSGAGGQGGSVWWVSP